MMGEMWMAITEYIEATETILDETANRLATYDGWTVSRFSGSALGDLVETLTSAQLPAAVVIYRGAERSQHPRRKLLLTVVVVTQHGKRESGAVNARVLLDKSFELLDEYAYNYATWEYRSDRAIDLGEGLTAYAVDIDVRLD